MANRVLELYTLLRNRYLPPHELRKLQERKLRAVVEHAYENVPYYRSLFRSSGLTPQDVRTLEDLQQVPITSKEALRAAGLEGSLAEGVDPAACEVTPSGGSTGKPFFSYYDACEVQTRILVGFRALHTAGVRPWDRIVGLNPRARPPSLMNRLGLYRRHYIPQFLDLEEQIQQLRKTQPTVLRIAPSKLRAILHLVDYRLSEIARPRILITSSEVLDDGLKRRVLADLDVDLFNFYVTAEFADLASDCPAHEGLHVNADQLIVECLDDHGQPVEPGKLGEIVVTSLYGFVMPFIRYRLGDISTPIEGTCSCGSTFPLISAPVGRQDDVLRLPSGKILSTINLGWIATSIDGVEQFRYTQESPDHFVLQLALWKHPGEEMLAQARRQVLDYLGEPVSFRVQIVDRLPEDKGKFRYFVSRVPMPDSTDR
ncbi:MAG TPA: phenylacetate--CoA ligase family protein [Chloroflexi bacterium]|nr:phenylacetate--CoA ligase family protein [Chloroflexota bacterium]